MSISKKKNLKYAIFIYDRKEYSKGDYRYLHLDPTTVAREAISVFIVGPTNILAV